MQEDSVSSNPIQRGAGTRNQSKYCKIACTSRIGSCTIYNKDQNIDFGAPFNSRAQQAVLGLENVEELLMAPKTKEIPWTDLGTNKQDFMHYITLGIVDTVNAEKGPDGKGRGGFASMVEDASNNKMIT